MPTRFLQPVAATVEAPALEKKMRSRPRRGASNPSHARASLIRLRPSSSAAGQALEPMTGNPIPLAENEIIVREQNPAQSSIVLNDPSIATRHARILQTENGEFHIRDEGSIARNMG